MMQKFAELKFDTLVDFHLDDAFGVLVFAFGIKGGVPGFGMDHDKETFDILFWEGADEEEPVKHFEDGYE